MKLNCIIVDDEPLSRELIKSYVDKTPFLHCVDCFGDSLEALEFIKTKGNCINLAFLDIEMPNLNGIELSNFIDSDVKIVFITAYEQYALDGFKINALDYLLKPVSYSDFLRAADRAAAYFGSAESGKKEKKHIFIKAELKLTKVLLKDILYIEGEKDYIKIHLDPMGESRSPTPNSPLCIMTLQSLKSMEENLPKDMFMRVHKSYIINTDQITCVERNRIVFNKEYIPISDSYKSQVDEYLKKHRSS